MAGNLFGKMAADTLGLSDIGKIISPKDFDKVDGDDYIMNEDGEKIYFVIKSKSDEYVFTNRGLLHVDGDSAVSKKRVVKRHDFYYEKVHSVTLETAGTIDLDIEIKFSFGNNSFSIDVDKKQLEQLKDLYKALVEIGRIQGKNSTSIEDGMNSLKMANEAISRSSLQGNASEIVKELTNFNFNWMQNIRNEYNNKDFGYVFEKYINKDFSNALGDLLPQKLIPVVIRLSGIDNGKKVHDITKEERKRLVSVIKGLELNITGTTGYNEAVITSGGIDVDEINP